MANKKKYNKPVKKNILMEEDVLFYIQDYCNINGLSDTDFINQAILDKIKNIEIEKNGSDFFN